MSSNINCWKIKLVGAMEQNKKRFLQDHKGFFLVDSMVAVLVTAIGLMAVAALFMQGIHYGDAASRHEKAVQYAGARLELIKGQETKDTAGKFKTKTEIEAFVDKLNAERRKVITQEKTEKYKDTRSVTYTVTTTLGETPLDTDPISKPYSETGDGLLLPVHVTVSWEQPEGTAQENSITEYAYVRCEKD